MTKPTILIAEDEPPVRKLLQSVLRTQHDLLVAEDGEEALQIARNHEGNIDLLLSNIVMPKLDGIELANMLKEERPEIKVLFVSAYDHGLLLLEHQAGWSFLPKPFVPRDLLHAVSLALCKTPADGSGC